MSNAAVDLVIRATLLLGAGLLVVLTLHRVSASVRHLVCAATLAGALVMAVLVPWAPRLDLPLSWWREVNAPSLTSASTEAVEQTDLPATSLPERTVVAPASGSSAHRLNVFIPLWLIVWASGTALVLGWTAWGRLGLRQVARRAQPITS